MRRLYVQLDQDFGTNMKLGRVGALATLVLLHLDALHHKKPADGLVSNGRASAASLAVGLGAFVHGIDKVVCDDIDEALGRLRDERLIEIHDDGSVYLPRWKDWSDRAMSGAERTRKWREKQKSVTPGDGVTSLRDESDVAEQSRAEHPRRVTKRHTGGSAAHTGDRNQSAGGPAPVTYDSPNLDAAIEAVLGHGYRSESKRRRVEARRITENVIQCGYGAEAIEELWQHAVDQGDNPEALFAKWLDDGVWREVLDEAAAKARREA